MTIVKIYTNCDIVKMNRHADTYMFRQSSYCLSSNDEWLIEKKFSSLIEIYPILYVCVCVWQHIF